MYTNNILRYVNEADIIEKEIKDGKFGMPGERFLSTVEVSKLRGVSLVTAQRILVTLRERKIIELCGKKYYLTHGRIPNKSPFGMQKNNKNKLIGLHITNIESQFFASLTKAIEECARVEGYNVLIASSMYKFEVEKEILNLFRQIGVSGVLSSPGTSEKTSSLYKNYVLPYVFLGIKPEGVNAESVLVNNFPAAKSIASHFISKGYQEFAYIKPSELSIGQDSRLAGFNHGLISEGYTLDEKNIISISAENFKNNTNEIERFLRGLQKPTGIFCFHDLIALNVLKTCHKLRIKIPEMVGIAGFDDLPFASNTSPQLTTVSYRVSEMAQTAVRLLINQINTGLENNTNYYVEPSIVIRESTSNINIKHHDNIQMDDTLYKISG